MKHCEHDYNGLYIEKISLLVEYINSNPFLEL